MICRLPRSTLFPYTTLFRSNQEFTGTTTQTVKLPVVSTLPVGFKFEVFNNSTGIVTVQSSGANTVYAIPAGESAEFTSILNTGTTAASWTYTTPNAGGSGSSNSYVKLTGAGTTYTVGATDTHILSQRAATQTFTLPTASSNANRQLWIRSNHNYAINSASSNVELNGTLGTSITAALGKWVMLISDGSNWVVVANN